MTQQHPYGDQRRSPSADPAMVSDRWGIGDEQVFVGDVDDLYAEDSYTDLERGYGGKPADEDIPMFGESVVEEPRVRPSADPDKPVKRRKRRQSRERVRVTERDVELIRFLARYKYATAAQIARFFSTSELAWSVRLPKLHRAGLLFWEWGANARPKLWMATEDALLFADMDLPAVKGISWGVLRHHLALTDLGIGFELDGEMVITEREIRAASLRKTRGVGRSGYGQGPTSRIGMAIDVLGGDADDRLEASWNATDKNLFGEDLVTTGVHSGVDYRTTGQIIRWGYTVPKPHSRGLGTPGGSAGLGHVPDMVILRQPSASGASSNIAVELELSRKRTGEWEQIIEGYARYDGFESVYYYCTDKAIARALVGVISRTVGARGKVFVRLFDVIDKSADPSTFGRGSGRKKTSNLILNPGAGTTIAVAPPKDTSRKAPPAEPAGTTPDVVTERQVKAKVTISEPALVSEPGEGRSLEPVPAAKTVSKTPPKVRVSRGRTPSKPVPAVASEWDDAPVASADLDWEDAPIADPSVGVGQTSDDGW